MQGGPCDRFSPRGRQRPGIVAGPNLSRARTRSLDQERRLERRPVRPVEGPRVRAVLCDAVAALFGGGRALQRLLLRISPLSAGIGRTAAAAREGRRTTLYGRDVACRAICRAR